MNHQTLKSHHRFLLLILFQFTFLIGLNAQYAVGSLDLSQNATRWYDQTAGKSKLGLFEGVYYVQEQAPVTPNSHLYFESTSWLPGGITFRNQAYEQVFMLYDLLNDVLVVQNESVFPAQPIQLNQSQISRFNWGNKQFVRLEEDQRPPNGSGFYQLLYEGDSITCLVKRRKIPQIKEAKAEFVEDSRYYVFDGVNFHVYGSRRTIYKLMPEHKKSLKQYLKTNELKPKPGNDADLILFFKESDKMIIQ